MQPKHGRGRLQNLDEQLDHWVAYRMEHKRTTWSSHRAFLENMQSSLERSLPRAYVEPLLNRVDELDEYLDEPLPWQTLTPIVPQHWEHVLREVIDDLDLEVFGRLIDLGTNEGKYGSLEVCRIIYHVLKDRMSDQDPRSNGWLI